jgi:uncharacterized membrane protein
MNFFENKYLTKDELRGLSGVITEMEKNTSGEIRVVVRHHRHWKERKLSLHDLALGEFYRLGMEKTRDRTGILILILFAERKFHIVADEGIHIHVQDGTWDKIADGMTGHFKNGNFFVGISEAIRAVGSELAQYFPRKSDDTNELPNEIIEQ